MALLMLINYLNPLYTGGLFHYYMLDNSICHLGCRVYLSLSIIFLWKLQLAKNVGLDQTADLGLAALFA